MSLFCVRKKLSDRGFLTIWVWDKMTILISEWTGPLNRPLKQIIKATSAVKASHVISKDLHLHAPENCAKNNSGGQSSLFPSVIDSTTYIIFFMWLTLITCTLDVQRITTLNECNEWLKNNMQRSDCIESTSILNQREATKTSQRQMTALYEKVISRHFHFQRSANNDPNPTVAQHPLKSKFARLSIPIYET